MSACLPACLPACLALILVYLHLKCLVAGIQLSCIRVARSRFKHDKTCKDRFLVSPPLLNIRSNTRGGALCYLSG